MKIGNVDKKYIVIVIAICIGLVLGLVAISVFQKNNQTSDENQSTSSEMKEKNVHVIKAASEEEIAAAKKIETEAIIQEDEKTKAENEKLNNEILANSTESYYIMVNYTANVVTVYTKDGNGEYSVPVRAMVCSTGTATPTSGAYKMSGYKRRWNALFGNVWGQYSSQIVGNILFHSVPYTDEDPSTLEYWEYDKLGTTASMGCVRLTVADAQWIYSNIPGGTYVEFYSDSNPGPLGKPSAQKISGNVTCRGWDPTDYTDGNPWRNTQTTETPKTESTPKPTVTPKAVSTPKPTATPIKPTETPIVVTPEPTAPAEPTPTPEESENNDDQEENNDENNINENIGDIVF